MKNLNLACGYIFVESDHWENCDFFPMNKNIKQINLLEKLPYKSKTFDSIYSSHFIEHISLNDLTSFLKECARILKKDGKIRLVLPDFENIVSEYMKNLNTGRVWQSQFNIVELIDQCTRKNSGGQLHEWCLKATKNAEFANYIKKRTGISIDTAKSKNDRSFFDRVQGLTPKKILKIFQLKLIFSLIRIFPKWFRINHFSQVVTGEQHLWMHDFNSLAIFLNEAGFSKVVKLDAKTSKINDFPIYPLDLDEQGTSRKGESSMYIEATKVY